MIEIRKLTPNNYTYPTQSFCGHFGHESVKVFGLSSGVITETGFFRDYDTIKFAINYINQTFKNLREKNIIVGACSTGEEVISLKMLMGEKPVRILGFDVGKKTIYQAKSGVYKLCIPKAHAENRCYVISHFDTFMDSFLITDKKNLNSEQKYLKTLFGRYLEYFEPNNNLVMKFFEKIKRTIDIAYEGLDVIFVKLKNPINNCEYKSGDIRELEKLTHNRQRSQLFSFKNAFYHLLTNYRYEDRPQLNPRKIQPMLDNIFKQVNRCLDKNGLFIMGEKEDGQGINTAIVSKALVNNGFIPIRMPNRTYPNIWKKVKEV